MASDSPYRISATDRGGLIVIVETLFMSWMVIVGLIRLYMRIAINGPVQIDDLALFVGSVSLLYTIYTTGPSTEEPFAPFYRRAIAKYASVYRD